MPKVSVILPVYNVEKYLLRSLNSIVVQTFKDFEVILVDDGSTDRSPEICDQFAKENKNTTVIHKKNGGLSSARNAGLAIAKGEYTYFMDSDDYIEPILLETCVSWMEKGYDLVAFNCEVKELDNSISVRDHEYGEFKMNSQRERFLFILNKMYEGKISWEVWALFFKKELIVKHNLSFYDNRLIFAEDQFFTVCYLAHCNSVISVSDVLYTYEKREGSLSQAVADRFEISRMSRCGHEVFNYCCQFEDCNYIVKRFPALYYCYVRGELRRARARLGEYNIEELRQLFIDLNEDRDFFVKHSKKISIYPQFFIRMRAPKEILKDIFMVNVLNNKRCGLMYMVAQFRCSSKKKALQTRNRY